MSLATPSRAMVGKRVQFNDESWEDLGALMRKRAPAEASAPSSREIPSKEGRERIKRKFDRHHAAKRFERNEIDSDAYGHC